MDRAKAKKLLNKKGWTGKEVGQAYLYSLSEQQRAQKERIPFKPPFTREDLDRMEQSITVQEQYIIFRSYAKLYNGLVDCSNFAEAQMQQTYSGFYRYLYTLKDCMQADATLKAVEKYPLIMTRVQYDRIKKELIEDRKAFRTSFYRTLIEVIEDWAAEPEEAPAAVRKAIEDTKKQPCTNTRILSNYNNDMGEGYYTLPDGTRSDKVTSEEWKQKLQDRFLAAHKLTINGEEATPEETLIHFNQERRINLEKLFFEGIEGVEKACKDMGIDWEAKGFTLEELLKTIEKELEFTGSIKLNKIAEEAFNIITDSDSGIVWHDAEEVPELTKYDVLVESEIMDNYRDCLIDDNENFINCKEFVEDYPALYKAAVKELKKMLPTAAKIKKEDFLQPLLTYGEIQEAGLTIHDCFLKVCNRDILEYYCKEDNTENMQKRLRIMYSGIAIIEEDGDSYSGYLLKDNIAENGDYVETHSNPYYLLESIDSITDDEDRMEEISQYTKYLIKPAIRYLYAYNALIDALSSVYDVSCISVLKKNMQYLETQIEAFNFLLYGFYTDVFGTPEEKARKRELIKQVYSPIILEELKPDSSRVQAVKDKLTSSYGKTQAAAIVADLHTLVLEVLGQGEGA